MIYIYILTTVLTNLQFWRSPQVQTMYVILDNSSHHRDSLAGSNQSLAASSPGPAAQQPPTQAKPNAANLMSKALAGFSAPKKAATPTAAASQQQQQQLAQVPMVKPAVVTAVQQQPQAATPPCKGRVGGLCVVATGLL